MITLQFKSHNDLATTLMRCLKRIMDCKQGPEVSLVKHKKKFLALLSTFKSYRGS